MWRGYLALWITVCALVLSACSEDHPTTTGPTVHCFNQDVATGKIQITCPTGQ